MAREKAAKNLRMIRVRQALRRACDAAGLGSRLIPVLIAALVLAGLAFGAAIAAGLSTSSVMVTALVTFALVAGAGLFLLGTASDEALAKGADALEAELQRIDAEPPPAPAPAAPAPVKPKVPAPAPAPSRATQPAPAVQVAPPPAPKPAKAPPAPSAPSVDPRTVVIDLFGYDPLKASVEQKTHTRDAFFVDGFDQSWVVGGGEYQNEMRDLTAGLAPEKNDDGRPGFWMTARLVQEEVRPAGWDRVTFFGSPVAIGTRPVRVVVNGKTIGFLSQKDARAHRKKMDELGHSGFTIEVPVRIYPPAEWMREPGYGAFVYLPDPYAPSNEPEEPAKPRAKPVPLEDLSDSAGKVVPLWSAADMAEWVSGQRSSILNDELTRYVRGSDLYQDALNAIAGKLKPVRYHSPAKSYPIDGRTITVPAFTGHEQLITVAELYIDDQPPANRDQIRRYRHVIDVGKKPVRVTIGGETVGFFESAEGRYHRKKLQDCGLGGAIAQVPAKIIKTYLTDSDGNQIPTLEVQVHLPKVYPT